MTDKPNPQLQDVELFSIAAQLLNRQPYEILEVWQQGDEFKVVTITGQQWTFTPQQIADKIGAELWQAIKDKFAPPAAAPLYPAALPKPKKT